MTIVQTPSYQYPSEAVEYLKAPAFVTQAGKTDAVPRRFAGVSVAPSLPNPAPVSMPVQKLAPMLEPPSPHPAPKIHTEEVTVRFRLNSTALDKSARSAIDNKIEQIRNAEKVEITGYTCPLGPKAYNDRLAGRRAEKVTEYLTAKNISPDNIVKKGLGKCCYVSTKDLSANRRTVVKIVTKGGDTNEE